MAKKVVVEVPPDVDEIWREVISSLAAISDMVSGARSGEDIFQGGVAPTRASPETGALNTYTALAARLREAMNEASDRPRLTSRPEDYQQLVSALSQRPVELYINSRKFAYATASDEHNAINDRKAVLHRGRGR